MTSQETDMKALALRPHWAWLVVNGYKDIENRSWPTRLPGRIWVHASSSLVTLNPCFPDLEVEKPTISFPEAATPPTTAPRHSGKTNDL